jgi:hypothetical protein
MPSIYKTDFGHYPDEPDISVPHETAALAAGALMNAAVILIDDLFADVHTLETEQATVADDPALMALPDLPPQYALCYDARLARKFLVTAVSITGRLAQSAWSSPACIAEALALNMVIEEAKVVLDISDLMDIDQAEEIYATFGESVYEDTDHRCSTAPNSTASAKTPTSLTWASTR